jgi:manganese-dependent inorganic pyrophosphatase
MSKILITSYISPDLDGTACALAYCEYMNEFEDIYESAFMGEVHEEALFVIDYFSLDKPIITTETVDCEKIILVDASELSVLEGRVDAAKVIEIIDHRKNNEAGKFINAKIQIELVGSAATLITEKFILDNKKISKSSAILLLCAIISNALNFKNTITTTRDVEAAKWLEKFVELPEDFWKLQFSAKSNVNGNKLSEKIDADFATFDIGNLKIGVGQLELFKAEEIISARSEEIFAILQNLKLEMNLDYVFISFLELENPKNYILCDNVFLQDKLEKSLNIKFIENKSIREIPLMRKQIIPLLKEEMLRSQ